MYQSECSYKNITIEEDKFPQNEFFPEQEYHTLHSKKKFVFYRYKLKYVKKKKCSRYRPGCGPEGVKRYSPTLP